MLRESPWGLPIFLATHTGEGLLAAHGVYAVGL